MLVVEIFFCGCEFIFVDWFLANEFCELKINKFIKEKIAKILENIFRKFFLIGKFLLNNFVVFLKVFLVKKFDEIIKLFDKNMGIKNKNKILKNSKK